VRPRIWLPGHCQQGGGGLRERTVWSECCGSASTGYSGVYANDARVISFKGIGRRGPPLEVEAQINGGPGSRKDQSSFAKY
jgi:hypothetical protein